MIHDVEKEKKIDFIFTMQKENPNEVKMPLVGRQIQIGFNPQIIKFAMIGQYGIKTPDMEWPGPEDLERFPRNTRIQLKEVRYKMNTYDLEHHKYRRLEQITALQLVYTGGVESPVFKLKGTKTHAWNSVQLDLAQGVRQCDMNMTASG